MINMFKKKNNFEKIDSYLSRNGHDLIASLYLENYNHYNIYIRFDYVKTIQAYKIVWIDMDFMNYKHIKDYINQQVMTRNMGLKLDRLLGNVNYENIYEENENILGDRLELVFNNRFGTKEYSFARFLPKKYKDLFDPIIIMFTYLPRAMEVILEEILAPYNDAEEYYNQLKPIRFNLQKDKIDKIFREDVITRGKKYYEENHILFLEKLDNKYLAVIKGNSKPYIVTIQEVNEDFTLIRCTCPCESYCKHEYATLLAIKEKKFNNFYKVRFNGKEETLLEKVKNGSYSLCCGVDGDFLLIITYEHEIVKMPIILNGKKCFEVIEDDDELTLSKYLEKF